MVCRLNQLLKKEVLQESLVGGFSHQGFFFPFYRNDEL